MCKVSKLLMLLLLVPFMYLDVLRLLNNQYCTTVPGTYFPKLCLYIILGVRRRRWRARLYGRSGHAPLLGIPCM
jgi:hypothetical protein